MRTFVLCLLFFLAACVSTPDRISGATTPQITNPTIATDLQSAAYNLDQAVAVGALPKDDPAPACLHDILVKAGIEVPAGQTAPKSFVPKHDGLASSGAIAYILARQAQQLAVVVPVSVSCEVLVGTIVIDGAKTLNKAATFGLVR